jgi:hypothetical protein
MQSIALPAATVARVEKMIAERNTMQALIDATIQTAREALGVPEGWELRELGRGFEGESAPTME